MTPLAREMLENYRQMMPRSTVTFRRAGEADCPARARVAGVAPDELVGGLDQTVRTMIVMAEDIKFASPLRRGDRVIMANGDNLLIEVCDADKRSVDGTLIAYEVTVMG